VEEDRESLAAHRDAVGLVQLRPDGLHEGDLLLVLTLEQLAGPVAAPEGLEALRRLLPEDTGAERVLALHGAEVGLGQGRGRERAHKLIKERVHGELPRVLVLGKGREVGGRHRAMCGGEEEFRAGEEGCGPSLRVGFKFNFTLKLNAFRRKTVNKAPRYTLQFYSEIEYYRAPDPL
jgi:hypothetical protein